MRLAQCALALCVIFSGLASAQVSEWTESAPNKNPPPHIEEEDDPTHPEFQGWHVGKVMDIKDKMKQIAGVQTHIEDLLDRIGDRQERLTVKDTVHHTLDVHHKAELKYLKSESERRIRAVMKGESASAKGMEVDDIVDSVAPKQLRHVSVAALEKELAAAKTPEEIRALTNEIRDHKIAAAEAAYRKHPTPKNKAELTDAKLPASCVAEAKAKGDRAMLARCESKDAAVAAAHDSVKNYETALKSGDPALIHAAAEQMEKAGEALASGGGSGGAAKDGKMPENLVREIEKVRWLVREKAGEERKNKAKELVQDLVQKAVEKREEQKAKVAEVVKQRKQLLENLRTRQQEAEATKAKAAEMIKQARAAKMLAQAKLVESKAEGKKLAELDVKLQDVAGSLAAMRVKQNEGIKHLLDVPPEE